MAGLSRTSAALLAAAVFALTGCDSPQEKERAAPTPSKATPPAAKSLTPFYVGRWAAAETACGHAAWEITEKGLETSGGVACTFERVTQTQTGVDIAARCTGEGASEVSTVRFAYAQSAQALLVEAEPFANVGLIACGS